MLCCHSYNRPMSRGAYTGGGGWRGSCPSCPFQRGAEGARSALKYKKIEIIESYRSLITTLTKLVMLISTVLENIRKMIHQHKNAENEKFVCDKVGHKRENGKDYR